jgi:hypothetical protein
MFSKFSNFFSIFKNLDKIKDILNTSYVALVKVHTSLVFIESQTNDTKLGKLISEYLPKTIEVTGKIKELFEKYGPLVGLQVEVVAQSFINEGTLVAELKQSSRELDKYLK